mgnify:CR=1 FL=1
MKKCIFRKNAYGFDEWCRCVRRITHDVMYCYTHFSSNKEYHCLYENEFNEYKIILEFKKHLTERQLFFFDNYLTRHHIVPKEYKFTMEEYRQMVEAWISLRFEDKRIIQMKEYSDAEFGLIIKNAREYDGRTRIEVADFIGISQNTLKMYEEGKRMIPSNVLLMLNQIYGENINIEIAFPKDPLNIF